MRVWTIEQHRYGSNHIVEIQPPLNDEPTAIYLCGTTIGLRAPLRDDAGFVDAWHEGPRSLTPDEAEALLQKEERIPWGYNPTIRLMIVDHDTRDVIGSSLVERAAQRTCTLTVTVNDRHPRQTGIQREAVNLIVPWLLDEVSLMVVTMTLPEDAEALISAATEAGLREVVRLREFIRRDERRIDLLTYERVNWNWGRRPGAGNHA